MIAGLCRLFGHRYEVERRFDWSALLTLARCRRCGRWGALVEVTKCRATGRTEDTYVDADAVAACRKRAA